MYSPRVRRKLQRHVWWLTAVLFLFFGVLYQSGVLDWLENRTWDWRVRAGLNPASADKSIVIIDIDNASFRELTDKLGRWPWTRRVWTELIRFVAAGRPRLILFDALFSGSEPGVDEEFAEVIRQAGNVVLPFALVSGRIHTDNPIFEPPASALVKLEGRFRGSEYTRADWSVNAPNPLLAGAMTATGSNLATPDPDGITRRLPLVFRYDERDWATLWLAAAMRLRGVGGGRFTGGEFHAGPIRVPVDSQGQHVIRWHGDSLTSYPLVPLWEMICSIYPGQCHPEVRRHAPDEFRGKIVIVGASASGSYEVRPTAVSETSPGFFIIATTLDNLLNNHGTRQAPAWLAWLLIALLSALPAWSLLRWRSVIAPLALTLGALAAYTGLCFLLYERSVWLPLAAPALAGAVIFSSNTVLRHLTVDRELSRTRGTLERYVSPQLVRHVMDNLDAFRFDGEKRRLTIFFSDVRNFTTLTEKSDPARLVRQLNEYLEAMTDIIFRHEGIVDKFIGDGVMAHWGAFTPERPNALLAARASLEMLEKLRDLNTRWEGEGNPPLQIGVGLNTDEVIFGNIGTGNKSDFTVIGDGVNLASRLESANKEYKTQIIISESTLRELNGRPFVRPLGSLVVKGKSVPVAIYELLSLEKSGD